MELTPAEDDYIDFMQWFQIAYPTLYMICWNAIMPAVTGEGVSFDKTVIDERSAKALSEVIGEYYSLPGDTTPL